MLIWLKFGHANSSSTLIWLTSLSINYSVTATRYLIRTLLRDTHVWCKICRSNSMLSVEWIECKIVLQYHSKYYALMMKTRLISPNQHSSSLRLFYIGRQVCSKVFFKTQLLGYIIDMISMFTGDLSNWLKHLLELFDNLFTSTYLKPSIFLW